MRVKIIFLHRKIRTNTHRHTQTYLQADVHVPRSPPISSIVLTVRRRATPPKVLWAVISETIPRMAALIENNEGHIEHMVAVVSPFPPSSSLFFPPLAPLLLLRPHTLSPLPPPHSPTHPPTHQPTRPDKSFSQTLPGLLAKMVPKRKDVVKVVVLFRGVDGGGRGSRREGRVGRAANPKSACGGRRPTPLRRALAKVLA